MKSWRKRTANQLQKRDTRDGQAPPNAPEDDILQGCAYVFLQPPNQGFRGPYSCRLPGIVEHTGIDVSLHTSVNRRCARVASVHRTMPLQPQ